MTLYLLNHLSTLGLVVLIVGGTTLLALVGAVVVRKAFPSIGDSGFEEITGVLRADVFALLYTIILALVIADQSGNLATASSTVSSEATALADLARGYNEFPAEVAVPMKRAIKEYVHAVVEDEWPKLKSGEQSPRAVAALDTLYAVYQNYDPQTPAQEAFYGSSVDALGQVTLNRRARVQQSQEGLSPLLRILLVVGALVFIVLAYPASVRRLSTQLVIVGAVSAFVSFAYFLTMVLDYPYAGEVSVDNSALSQGVLKQFWSAETAPRPLAQAMTGRLAPRSMVGQWNSDIAKFGVIVFRETGGEIHGVYRHDKGRVIGTVSEDGVFRGWWCEGPSRKMPEDAGKVEWRLLKGATGKTTILDGRWRYGGAEPWRGGWDLTKIEGSEPPDLEVGFDDSTTFCRHP